MERGVSCVCERERERERKRKKGEKKGEKKEGERERERERECESIQSSSAKKHFKLRHSKAKRCEKKKRLQK